MRAELQELLRWTCVALEVEVVVGTSSYWQDKNETSKHLRRAPSWNCLEKISPERTIGAEAERQLQEVSRRGQCGVQVVTSTLEGGDCFGASSSTFSNQENGSL